MGDSQAMDLQEGEPSNMQPELRGTADKLQEEFPEHSVSEQMFSLIKMSSTLIRFAHTNIFGQLENDKGWGHLFACNLCCHKNVYGGTSVTSVCTLKLLTANQKYEKFQLKGRLPGKQNMNIHIWVLIKYAKFSCL